MKRIISIFLTCLILTACEQQLKEGDTASNNVAVQNTPETSFVVETDTAKEDIKMNSDQAHEFANNYLSKLNEQELFMNDAIKLKERNTLEKISMDSFPGWPQSNSLDPYTKCDAAWRDLSILAGANGRLLREETAIGIKIVRQESDDYAKSKKMCEDRVAMTAEQAVIAEAKE